MSGAAIPVPYDPELEPGLAAFLDLVERIPLRADTIGVNRDHFATIIPSMQEQVAGRAVTWEDRTIPGPAGAPEIVVTIVRPAAGAAAPRSAPRSAPRAAPRAAGGSPEAASPEAAGSEAAASGIRAPAVLSIHGGGMILGTRFFGTAEIIDLAERHGAVGVAVEYRLAPEHRGPAQAEDCYAALVWMAQHADELGIDPERIIVSGASAGGGLSAAVALMARDRGGPAIAGQLLNCPMLDDRNETTSARQYDGIGAWDRNNNDTAWDAICGNDRFTDRVSPYAAPARAEDLSGLPPAYIDVGAAETFRDEAVAYATGIWATGGQAELHVWAGGFHGFSGFAPDAAVSRAATAARESWLRRLLG